MIKIGDPGAAIAPHDDARDRRPEEAFALVAGHVLGRSCGTGGQREWPLKVKSGVEAILDFTHANPEQARLLAVRLDGADVELGESVRASEGRRTQIPGLRSPRISWLICVQGAQEAA